MAERTQDTLTTVRSAVTSTEVEEQRDPVQETRDTLVDVFVFNATTVTGRPFQPFLSINGVTFPVKLAAPTHEEVLIGSQRRTFNGTVRSGIRRRRREFVVVTPLLPRDEANELLEMLQGPPPFQVVSFLFKTDDAVSCHVGVISGGYNRGGDIGARWPRDIQLVSLEFTLIPE